MQDQDNPSGQDDEYAAAVQLLRDAALNQEAAAKAQFAGRPVDLADHSSIEAAAVEPEEFKALAATSRRSEDAVLRALLRLAYRDPRIAQRAVVESGTDWLWILLRALESVEGGDA